MLQDVGFALRLIVKDRWFTLVAVTALALGIGLNATVFTLVNAVLIRGLPFADSDSLYIVGWLNQSGRATGASGAELADWREQSRAFSALAAWSNTNLTISDDRGLPEQARSAWLTANTFSTLGQTTLIGRDFAPDEDRKGAPGVVILGYNIWKNRYALDPSVVGRSIRLNGQPATIVGVMPEGMKFPSNAELWAPWIPTTTAMEQRTFRGLNVFGRLRKGVSRTEAITEMNGIGSRLAIAYPEAHKELKQVTLQTFVERFNGGEAKVMFLSMMGAVGFVLLIACANVANLLLSRSAKRAREIGVRIALGATRWRVVRQLLVESIVLGLIAGALGLLLSLGGVRAFDAALADSGKPYWIEFTLDYTVMGFLAAVCVLTGLLFGLAPALQVSKTNLNEVMKDGGRGSSGGRRARWLTGTMVVVELALTIVLLVGAGLMVRSFLKMYTVDLGIGTKNIMVMGLQLFDTKYEKPEARRAFYERLEPKLAAIPGAEAVAISTSVPPNGAGTRILEIDGRPPHKPEESLLEVAVVTVSPKFFDVVRIQMLRGRCFGEHDGAPGSETVVINERFVAQHFAGEDPIGRRIRFVPRTPAPNQPTPVWRTVVGISPTIRHSSPEDGDPNAVAYVPLRQELPRGASVVVRSSLEPGFVMHAVGREVQGIDQDQPVAAVQTLEQMLARSMWPHRVFGSLFAIFAFIGLLLSAVGLYAVMAYSVLQRTQEIGVRMALGAGGRQVSWLIFRRGLVQVAIGLVLGLAGAFGLSRVLRQFLVQITPTDPVTFITISVLLVTVALAACLIPARRATRVDPLVALRAE